MPKHDGRESYNMVLVVTLHEGDVKTDMRVFSIVKDILVFSYLIEFHLCIKEKFYMNFFI